jgi:hypothetical protein
VDNVDPQHLVDCVCTHLQREAEGRDAAPAAVDPAASRHARLYREACERLERGDALAAKFRQEVDPLLRRYQGLLAHPVPWAAAPSGDGGCGGDPVKPTALAQRLCAVRHALWLVAERYVPGLLARPTTDAGDAAAGPPPLPGHPRTSCAMCCADMQGASTVCDVCNTVLAGRSSCRARTARVRTKSV